MFAGAQQYTDRPYYGHLERRLEAREDHVLVLHPGGKLLHLFTAVTLAQALPCQLKKRVDEFEAVTLKLTNQSLIGICRGVPWILYSCARVHLGC